MKELNKIQCELKANKDLYNAFSNFGYRSTETILEALKPLLKETGCIITLTDELEEKGSRIYIKATATIKNPENESVSTSAYAREPESKKGSDESQLTGSASSYARKYALCGLFAIDDGRDSDSIEPTPITENKLKSEFSTAKKKIDGCKTRADLVELNKKYEDLWGYLPYTQYRDTKYNNLPK